MIFDLFNYNRRLTSEVKIGSLRMGSKNPIRIQSMANTDTKEIEKSVEQCIRTVHTGCEMMRYTAQGTREVESLRQIHNTLRLKGYNIPLVADIHFNSSLAELAARYVEKVRINPGNFISNIKSKSDASNYTDQEYQQEFNLLKEKFISLLHICKQHNTAIRIGVNHGSLSERIMNRYGDTPEGMVASCMELLAVCREQDFHNVIISLKTSNTVFMVYAVRLLVSEMEKEDYSYPLHLGVTEAGEGLDGRIKSAVGIGALLSDGIGDTIRVSLSEDPEYEIPVAQALANYFEQRVNHDQIKSSAFSSKEWIKYEKRKTHTVRNIGGDNVPIVMSPAKSSSILKPDYIFNEIKIIDENGIIHKIYNKNELNEITKRDDEIVFLKLSYDDLNNDLSEFLLTHKNIAILLNINHMHKIGEARAFFHTLMNANCKTPVILHIQYEENNLENLQIKASSDFGSIFIDGFGDGIFIENKGEISEDEINTLAFGILQAARVRISKTEYISCPGCGRTLFDLQQVISKIKEASSQFKGLKIAIMGCIVNGPGEMADADYGYVGAGHGKISLYKKKECIDRNIPETEAVEKLISLIEKEEKLKKDKQSI